MTHFHPLPDTHPGLVVMYLPWDDDLTVVDAEQLRQVPTLTHGPKPADVDTGIGEVAARNAMVDALNRLEQIGVLPTGYSAASAGLGVWREHSSRGPDRVAEWIAEYQFTMNRIVDGLEVIDAGVRIGVHRDGGVSSIRITDVQVARVSGPHPVTVSIPEAREKLLAAEQSRFPQAFVHVERERLGLLLGPNDETALLPPSVVFNFGLRFEAAGKTAVSRQKISTVSLLSRDYTQLYPVPARAD